MPDQRPKISIIGILLVAVGVVLLLDRVHLVYFGFGRILWLFLAFVGGWLVVRSFLYNERGKAFWGTLLFLFSVFFFLRTFYIVGFHFRTFPAAVLFILGFGFLMLFVQNPRAWQVLIPAGLLGGLGAVFILADLGYLYRWDVEYAIRTYWPVILILIGLLLVFKRRERQLPKSATEGGGEAAPPLGT